MIGCSLWNILISPKDKYFTRSQDDYFPTPTKAVVGRIAMAGRRASEGANLNPAYTLRIQDAS